MYSSVPGVLAHDPDDLALIINLRDQVARLLADALQTKIETRRETARVHRASVLESARVQGGHDGEMGAMHDALDGTDERARERATREGIGQAVGILIATIVCTPDEAFDLLVLQAHHENRKLVEIAAEIVEHAVGRASPSRSVRPGFSARRGHRAPPHRGGRCHHVPTTPRFVAWDHPA